MKKIISVILLVLLLTSQTALLSSCSTFKPKTAKELWEKIDSEMNKLDSYEITTTIRMTIYAAEQEIKTEGKNEIVQIGLTSGNYYYYDKMSAEVKCEALGIDEKEESLKAYCDGNFFIVNNSETAEQKLYSQMSKEDALAIIDEEDSSELINVYAAAKTEFSATDAKGWKLVCSEHNKEFMDKLAESFELDAASLGVTLKDVTVTLVANKALLVESIELEFTFDAEDDSVKKPYLKVKAEFSKHGEASRRDDQHKAEDFTKVDNVKLLFDIEDAIEAFAENKSGNFAVNIMQYSVLQGNQAKKYTEENTVSFSDDESGYYYNIASKINQVPYTIEHKDGVRTVKGIVSIEKNEETDDAAKSFIKGLVESPSYNSKCVTSIKKLEDDDKYELICEKIDSSKYLSTYVQNQGYIENATQTIVVTFKDGKVFDISSKIMIKGKVKLNTVEQSLKMGSEVYCSFE